MADIVAQDRLSVNDSVSFRPSVEVVLSDLPQRFDLGIIRVIEGLLDHILSRLVGVSVTLR